MKNALTIDVEDYYHVAAFKRVIDAERWDDYDSRVLANTRRFIELTAEFGVRSTFFVLGWVADRFPEVVAEAHAAGHEIASHGYSHQLIYEQTPETFRQETERSKKLLEDIIQAPIRGYRAASYSVTPASLWALDIIAEAGFEYDSSIYPIRHDNYGLMGGPHRPYRILLDHDRSLVEFPITTVEIAGTTLPVGGGGYFRLYPYWLTDRLLKKRTREQAAPFVFYLHPWELDPEQPRVDGAGLLSRFRHYNNLGKVDARLRQLLDDFDFTSMGEVLDALEHELPEHRY